MRVACVSIAHLAAQVAVIENPQLHEQPVVIGGFPFDDAPVFDVSPEAAEYGIVAGMRLRQAYSLCPQATFLQRNELLCKGIFEEVLGILDGFSPVVESETLGCAYLDVKGVANEQEMAGNILHGILIGTGLRASIGLSSGKFFSKVAAITSEPGAVVVLDRRGEKDFIAPFSIDLLPCPTGTRERLSILGIRSIGQLTSFSHNDLMAQFGTDGKTMYELACGHDRSLLVPRQKPDMITDTLELCTPSVSCLEILQSCEVMLRNLLPSIESRGKLCCEAVLRLHFESKTPREMRLIFKEATRHELTIMKRLKACTEHIEFPGPVVRLELKLLLINETGKNLRLWQGDGGNPDTIGQLTVELQRRFGYQPLKRIKVVDSGAIFPERRTRLVEMNDRE